jgi:hypothetical protein
MRKTAAFIGKVKALLGWTPEVDPREGFLRTAVWHMENQS